MADQTYIGEELNLFAEATHWKLYFAEQIRPFVGRRVLEVGAGLGATTKILCRGTESEWICLEPDPTLRAAIDQKIAAGQLPSNCRTRGGLITTLDPAERFDTILYIDVLEHIEKDREELGASSQLLGPGGTLVILSPAHGFLYSPFDRQIGHYRRYNREMLKGLTPPHCRMVRLVYLDSVGMLTSLANRLFLQRGIPTAQQLRFWDHYLVRISRRVDPVIRFSTGRSILGVWEKTDA